MLKKVIPLPVVAFFFFTFVFAYNGFVQSSLAWVLFCSPVLSHRGCFTGGVEYHFLDTQDKIYIIDFFKQGAISRVKPWKSEYFSMPSGNSIADYGGYIRRHDIFKLNMIQDK